MEEKFYDTVEAAAFLELSRETVNLLALKGKLPSQKFGRARLIRETDLVAFKAIDRKPGRPPKSKPADEPATTAEKRATAAEPLTPKVKAKPKAKRAKAMVAALTEAKPKRAGKKAKAKAA